MFIVTVRHQQQQRYSVNGSEMPPSDCGRIGKVKLHPPLADSAEREWARLVSMATTDRRGGKSGKAHENIDPSCCHQTLARTCTKMRKLPSQPLDADMMLSEMDFNGGSGYFGKNTLVSYTPYRQKSYD